MTELDEKFIAQQKQRLQELKEELLRVRRGMGEDERQRSEEERDTQLDSGDMSQEMFTREIEEGTYGLCDDTGEPIPKGRLEAAPEAIRTVEAQQRYERERRPPF
jgi:DnaK suppressor protein